MRNNNSDYNSEAVKIANALKPMFKTWFDEWARSCVRVKKMTVSTAPSNGIVGVKDAFSDKEIFAKYTPSVANAKVGDTVWCRWYFDNMQTLYASDMGNVSSADASFDNATINNDLFVYGDLSLGSTTLTEAEAGKLVGIGSTFTPTPSGVTLANSAMTTVVSQELTTGLWLVSYRVRFPSNATGLRKALASLSQDSSTSIGLMCDDERQAVSGDWTYCAATFLRRTTATETIYINASQNSGASMSGVYGRLQAVRVG